jgi:uncharacterized repeat protein (TIGR02543 family)
VPQLTRDGYLFAGWGIYLANSSNNNPTNIADMNLGVYDHTTLTYTIGSQHVLLVALWY